MQRDVKQTAAPGGPGQLRTRLARQAVVAAARTLFLERGYAASTVEAISNLAEVPSATVYRLFASKIGILKALLDTSIAGDDQPVAVEDRPNVVLLFAEPDPIRLLTGFAGVTTAINQRTNDIYRVLVSAAGSDSAAAGLLDNLQQQRDSGQRQIVNALARNGSLRDGLQEQDAMDMVHAIMSPEVYRLLVVDRSWAAEKYQTWLATTLVQQLI